MAAREGGQWGQNTPPPGLSKFSTGLWRCMERKELDIAFAPIPNRLPPPLMVGVTLDVRINARDFGAGRGSFPIHGIHEYVIASFIVV